MTDSLGGGRVGPSPPTLWSDLPTIERHLDRADGLFLALDFDGTLAPIQADPDAVEVPEATRTTLDRLMNRQRIELAIVTGRQVADVRNRLGFATLNYAGNHGLRLVHNDTVTIHQEAVASVDAIDETCERLSMRLADWDGCFVENNVLSATIHYRQASEGVGPVVREMIEEIIDELGYTEALTVTDGKRIYELRPPVDWDKGRAVEWLRERIVPDGQRWQTVYVGDDVTDEAAFRTVGNDGLSIVVGRPTRSTAARYRLANTGDVRSFLSWLADSGADLLDQDKQHVETE